jgi:RNA polymerase sigma-70 factor (ECF subfamily)
MDAAQRAKWIQHLVQCFEGPLIRYAQHLLNDLDRARDVVQDTFLKLCSENPDQLGDHPAAWLYKVCRNRAVDVFRKEKRMNPLEEEHLAVLESSAPSPLEVLEKNETELRVIDLLNRLPKRQQEVIRLKFQSDLSYKEISQITGNSVTNVGFLIHTGMKTLREHLHHGAR